MSKWRADKLAKHVFDRIPEYVLTAEELSLLNPLRPFTMIERALPLFTDINNPSAGGEVGELIGHSLCIRDFGTEPLIKRLSYKMRSRDAVTSFDITHIRVDERGEIELWLGEAKFYSSRSSAITSAISSLSDHINEGVLTEFKYITGPKISRDHPHYDKLQWLFHEDTVLDELISRIVIPVFIAADTYAKQAGELSDDFDDLVIKELQHIVDRITDAYSVDVEFVFIYLPLNNKSLFDKKFNARLAAFV